MKLATFLISSAKRILTKLLRFSESLIKIKVRSCWTLFLILLQQLFANNDFCMETRLCNIFKTANAMTLTKTILESPYEQLQGLCKGAIFNNPHNFQWAFNFTLLLSFKLS